jgi:DNA invertase Pin-like site-specific DNA recombinase
MYNSCLEVFMVYGYVRVSTEQQSYESQVLAISQRFKVDTWVEEKRSGTVEVSKRDLGELIHKLQAGDVLVVTELSRLGRSLAMIYQVVTELKNKKVRCVAIKNSFDLNPANQNDIVAEVIMFAFGLSAQLERQLISECSKMGIQKAKEQGKQIGKRKGDIPYYVKLRPYQAEIIEKRKNGGTILGLAKQYNVTWKTMQSFLNKRIYQLPPPPLLERPKRHGHPSYRELQYFKTHGDM